MVDLQPEHESDEENEEEEEDEPLTAVVEPPKVTPVEPTPPTLSRTRTHAPTRAPEQVKPNVVSPQEEKRAFEEAKTTELEKPKKKKRKELINLLEEMQMTQEDSEQVTL